MFPRLRGERRCCAADSYVTTTRVVVRATPTAFPKATSDSSFGATVGRHKKLFQSAAFSATKLFRSSTSSCRAAFNNFFFRRLASLVCARFTLICCRKWARCCRNSSNSALRTCHAQAGRFFSASAKKVLWFDGTTRELGVFKLSPPPKKG